MGCKQTLKFGYFWTFFGCFPSSTAKKNLSAKWQPKESSNQKVEENSESWNTFLEIEFTIINPELLQVDRNLTRKTIVFLYTTTIMILFNRITNIFAHMSELFPCNVGMTKLFLQLQTVYSYFKICALVCCPNVPFYVANVLFYVVHKFAQICMLSIDFRIWIVCWTPKKGCKKQCYEYIWIRQNCLHPNISASQFLLFN